MLVRTWSTEEEGSILRDMIDFARISVREAVTLHRATETSSTDELAVLGIAVNDDGEKAVGADSRNVESKSGAS